jgi:hypothetical protein
MHTYVLLILSFYNAFFAELIDYDANFPGDYEDQRNRRY